MITKRVLRSHGGVEKHEAWRKIVIMKGLLRRYSGVNQHEDNFDISLDSIAILESAWGRLDDPSR